MAKSLSIGGLIPQFGIVVLNDKMVHGIAKQPSKPQLSMLSGSPVKCMTKQDFAKG
jgi:hypothetical protein